MLRCMLAIQTVDVKHQANGMVCVLQEHGSDLSVDKRPCMTLMVSLQEDEEWEALQDLSDELTRHAARFPSETQGFIIELLALDCFKHGMVTVNEQVSNYRAVASV